MKYLGRASRMQRHHKRNSSKDGINLVSMIDMLTVLVFFLFGLVYMESSLGIGILSAALKKGELRDKAYRQMLETTIQLNKPGIALSELESVHAGAWLADAARQVSAHKRIIMGDV